MSQVDASPTGKKIMIVAHELVDRPQREIIEDAIEYLIDVLDQLDASAEDTEPDYDDEDSDSGDDKNCGEWRPKTRLKVVK